jgi:peptide/nickel transport system substrate-binding protein
LGAVGEHPTSFERKERKMASEVEDIKPGENAWLAAGALSRRELVVRGGIAVGATLLAGGGAALAAPRRVTRLSATAPKRGGSLVWGAEADPTFLIPLGVDATASWRVSSFIYESLLRWDRNLKVLPALATSWSNPNSTTWIFNLRQGVKFHDGKEMTSEDVKYSLEHQKSPPPPGLDEGQYPPIVAIDALGKYQIRLRTQTPAANMVGYFAWCRYSQIIPAGLYESTDVRTHTNGTGPFMLQEYVPNDHVTLVRNPNYWRSGLPYLDSLTFKVLQDEGTRLSALVSGAIDGTRLSPDSARVAAKNPSLRIQKGLTAGFNEIDIALRGHTNKPWHDVRVRQAANLAINRQAIIDKVFAGQAVYSSKISPGYGDWAPSESELRKKWERYDPAKARELLKAAGFGNGFELTMNSIAQPVQYTQTAEVIADQLRKVGIHVKVQPMDIGTFSKHDGDGSFEWESTGRGMRGDPSGFMADFDPTGGVYKAWFAGGGWRNPEMFRLIKLGISTLDLRKRHQLYKRMNEIVMTEWPLIPLVDPLNFQAVNMRVHGSYLAYTTSDLDLAEAWVD